MKQTTIAAYSRAGLWSLPPRLASMYPSCAPNIRNRRISLRYIAAKAGFGRHTRIRGPQPNHNLHRIVHNGTIITVASKYIRNQTIDIWLHCQIDFETLLLSSRGMTMSARETAELLLLVGRLVQADGYDGKLSPAQWMALRFFARANQFSRTPSAFAEFQATTRGTASQAIKALEAGGYLVRQRSKADGRSTSLRLTTKGNKTLVRDPFEALVRAVDLLDAKERNVMRLALQQVLATVVASGTHRRFGVCQGCAHLGGEMCAGPSAAECVLFGVPIQPEEVDLLCVHFQPTSEHRDDDAVNELPPQSAGGRVD